MTNLTITKNKKEIAANITDVEDHITQIHFKYNNEAYVFIIDTKEVNWNVVDDFEIRVVIDDSLEWIASNDDCEINKINSKLTGWDASNCALKPFYNLLKTKLTTDKAE